LKIQTVKPIRNIICVGKNYADHAKEIRETKLATQGADMLPTAPVFFTKSAYSLIGNNEKIKISGVTEQADYEVELAVIIGREGRNIPPENAHEYIFGYSIINDITARDIQVKHGQWFLGKSADTFCPFGPIIVTADEIPYPPTLDITCRVNGEVRQKSNTCNFIFGISEIISTLSKIFTLYPNDIIATGTPSGIGAAMSPPKFLKAGDIVECQIEKIGILTNVCE
jgi:2-keto-4-pentenoate hydratase/2-oxohepta-3-ene-1,7-dioic acid hydratase in catechol pathway